MPMRVLITGDRYWTDYDIIHSLLSVFPSGTVVIHGACRGADQLADKAARDLGFTTLPFPASWRSLGPSAGPRRNTQMLRDGKPNVVLAFHANLKDSKGTADMVRKAQDANVPVLLYNGKDIHRL
jgi:ABC-type sugar transport system substrate-binding protein